MEVAFAPLVATLRTVWVLEVAAVEVDERLRIEPLDREEEDKEKALAVVTPLKEKSVV